MADTLVGISTANPGVTAMTAHEFTAGPPTTLEDDARRDATIATQLGRRVAPVDNSDEILGLNNVDVPGGHDGSDLSTIAAELATSGGVNTLVLDIERRPGYAAEFDVTFDSVTVEKVRKASKDRNFEGKIDGVKFAALLLAKTCIAITRHGEPIPLESGRAATFLEPEFLDLMQREDERQPVKSVDGVKRFYVLEGHVEAHAKALMQAAGWGDEAREADPTR